MSKRTYRIKKVDKKQKKHILKGGENLGKECDPELFPELPSILNTDPTKVDRIIAIGDIHGDLHLAIRYLEIPKLIKRVYVENEMTVSLWYKDESTKRIYEWIGRKTIAVQVGDQVDRCRPYKTTCEAPETTIHDEASDLVIMFFYSDLHNVALKVDCGLFSLLGNHELLNVMGNMQYVSYKGLIEFPSPTDNIFKGRIDAFKLKSQEKLYKTKASLSEFLGCSRLSSMDIYLFMQVSWKN
jgi:hypothetical protein